MNDNDVQVFTGDEIHFTDGTVWSCTFLSRFEGVVVFVACAFKDIPQYCVRDFFPDDVKPLILDAIKGGAKILKGVGIAKNKNRRGKKNE